MDIGESCIEDYVELCVPHSVLLMYLQPRLLGGIQPPHYQSFEPRSPQPLNSYQGI